MSQLFHLSSPASSLVLLSRGECLPEILYWGARLELQQGERDQLMQSQLPPVPQGFLDEAVPITLLPTLGEGAFHYNALSGHRVGQAWAPQFKIDSIEASTPSQLTLVASDGRAQLQVTLVLRINAWNVLETSIDLKNVGASDYSLENLGLSLVLPESLSEITQFHGRWLHEFQTQKSTWDQPNYSVENLKGRTSSDNPSLLLLAEPGCGEQSGVVYAFHLAWSGNHYYKLMTLPDGRRLVQFGEKLLPGEILLGPGETHPSPVLYATFSDRGTQKISGNFHEFIRRSPTLASHRLPYRPVHFNTWEAMYFDHSLEKLGLLVDRAHQIGVERFILDDGWYRGRNHDRAGLGDWFVDQQKYPQGLAPLIHQVLSRGMQFGLWFEPEMVNADSDLYRAHPDWVLRVAGYSQPLGRCQYALNLANPAAYDYIYGCLTSLLSSHPISYIKWDMNRDLVQPGGDDSRAGVHRQVQALYRMLDQLRAEFPELEIESCASGGARADLGILRYTNRIWTSDCNDPLEREQIQRGFSTFFPPELMGSHVGPEQAHTTNRRSRLEYRMIMSLFGHLGLELNLLELSDPELDTLKHYVGLYKSHRDLLHGGQYVRLQGRHNGCGVVHPDKNQAIFMVAQQDFPKFMLPSPLKLNFFPPDWQYRVKLLNEPENSDYLMKHKPSISSSSLRLSGNVLGRFGIQLPILHPQSALLLLIERTKEA